MQGKERESMKINYLIALVSFLLLIGCQSPTLGGKKVKREYFTGGGLRSEFIMDDESGLNGLLKKYGPEGELTSTVPIKNGLKNGIETLYDKEGKTVLQTPYVNGKKEGIQKAYFPDGSIWYTMPFKNDKREGHAVMYDQKGHIVSEANYSDDVRID